jgi:MYXO-CTERM domain-containing protein
MGRSKGKPGGADAARNLGRMGVGVLAGGLMFVGRANAAPIVDEGFEASPSSLFGAFSSYGYAENYTSVNIAPDSGLRYFTGTTGQATQTHQGTVALTGIPNGVPAAAIDAGLANFNLSAYFSTYADQTDFSEVRLQFKNAGGQDVGDLVTIGGQEFINSLGFDVNGAGAEGYRDFGLDSASGLIPAGARSAGLTIFTQRNQGAAADGYLDVLRLEVSAVPEPGAAGLAAFAAALAGLRRRRRAT